MVAPARPANIWFERCGTGGRTSAGASREAAKHGHGTTQHSQGLATLGLGARRLAVLRSLRDQEYQALTRLASRLCHLDQAVTEAAPRRPS